MLSIEKQTAIAELVSFLNNNTFEEITTLATSTLETERNLANIWLSLSRQEEIQITGPAPTEHEITNDLQFCIVQLATLQRSNNPESALLMKNFAHEIRLLLIQNIIHDLDAGQPESTFAYLIKYCTAFIETVDHPTEDTEFLLNKAIIVLVEFKKYLSSLYLGPNYAGWNNFYQLVMANEPKQFLMAHMRLYNVTDDFMQYMEDLQGDLQPALDSLHDFYSRDGIDIGVDIRPIIAVYARWHDSHTAQAFSAQEPSNIVDYRPVAITEAPKQTPSEMLIGYLLENSQLEFLSGLQEGDINVDSSKFAQLREYLHTMQQPHLLIALTELEQSQQSYVGWMFSAAKAKITGYFKQDEAKVVEPPAVGAIVVAPPAHNGEEEEETYYPGQAVRL